MLEVDLGAVNTKTVTANADYWASLPDEVKTAIQEVSVAYRDHLADIAMDRAEESRAAYIAAGGTIVTPSEAEIAAWAAAMPDIAAEWAKVLDDKGENGSAMLRAYLGKLNAEGYTGVRDWTTGLATN